MPQHLPELSYLASPAGDNEHHSGPDLLDFKQPFSPHITDAPLPEAVDTWFVDGEPAYTAVNAWPVMPLSPTLRP